MNVTSTIAVRCSVATSSSEPLAKYGEKPNQPKRFMFPKCDYGKISVMYALALSRSGIHKFDQVYWKDGLSGKSDAFCKGKPSSLHYQAVEVNLKFAKKQP